MKNEIKMVNALEIRDNAAHNSDPYDFGIDGANGGIIIVENSLDQIVANQLQARAKGGSQWFDVGAAVNAAAIAAGVLGTATITLTVPYPLLRVVQTAPGVPTLGSVSAWLLLVLGGAA